MVYITVGYVAGVIAAGISVARIWSPTVLTFILSGILGDRNSAATWTVAARALERTRWPDVLRSDSVKNNGARKSVVFLTKLVSLMGFLILIAGVVTPLGLYQTLEPAQNVQTPFKYLKDDSPFGFGTPPRSNLSFNRNCGSGYLPCPFSDTVVIQATGSDGNGTVDFPYGYDISIPEVLRNVYSSGVGNDTTISNYFDIQWRRYVTTSTVGSSAKDWNNGSSYIVQGFRLMQTMALNNAIEPVEGLIVDTVNGGIGFRNHTVPPGFQFGAEWEEDLLFIEPETVCVDTNTTIDYTIGATVNGTNTIIDLVLTDRGGFVNVQQAFPVANLTNPQGNPDLWTRAYKAAWMTNTFTMLYYNVTNTHNDTSGEGAFAYLNSYVGKTFPLVNLNEQSDYDSLAMDSTFNVHLNFPGEGAAGNYSDPAAGGLPNPFEISDSNFTDVGMLCAGAGKDDYANITNIYVKCALMRGIPQRQDDGSSILFDPGSRWTQPLYSCASSVKATIKTVSFLFNGTDGLSDLKVTGVQPKKYLDASSMPLWGVENTGNAYAMEDLSVIWGLVDSKYENNPNVSTVRQESLYLTGYYSTFSSDLSSIGYENLPASDFYSGAMNSAYDVGGGGISNAPLDYSGETNMAMWARWQSLSNSTTTASMIPDLIFTDFAAAAVVGTKGILGPGNAAASNIVPLPVTPTISVIRYHWPFAIPALIAALGILFFTALAVITMVCRRHGIGRLRTHLNQLSPGRIFTTFLSPEPGAMSLNANEWSKRMGKHMVDLSGNFPDSSSLSTLQEKPTAVTGYQSVSDEHSAEGVGFLNGTVHAHQGPQSYVGVQGYSHATHYV